LENTVRFDNGFPSLVDTGVMSIEKGRPNNGNDFPWGVGGWGRGCIIIVPNIPFNF